MESLSKCHKDAIGSTRKGQGDETGDRKVSARTDAKETHKGRKMFSGNEIDQVAGV